jgi:hypothetical protein
MGTACDGPGWVLNILNTPCTWTEIPLRCFPARDGPVNLVVILEYHRKPASQESCYIDSQTRKDRIGEKLQI